VKPGTIEKAAFIAVLFQVALRVEAAPPFEMASLADDATRVGGPVKAVRVIADANTTTYFIPSENGGSVPAVFSWNTTVAITASDEATVCFVMTTDGTLGSQATTAATTFTDGNGPDGAAACVALSPHERHDAIPHYRSLVKAIGGRTGVCSAFVTDQSSELVRPPCRIDTDCTTTFGLSGATCITAPTEAQLQQSGAIATAKALNANTKITAGPER
jgi:hypothetical protein